jgi:hypothetical protein
MSDDKTPEGRSLPQAVREVWLSALGVFNSAEHKLMETLGLNPEQPLGVELLARVRKNREELERRIDEGVKTAVARVRAPIDKEIAAMRARLEKLQARIEERRKPKPNDEA